ncbi:MAG: efflux RND transporter periplasmic adaptor subunit [Deltaproteobacteria bacterium]|nr:efflux RND transporter periplasmic adaptor subunit [Deltaproteobacteria bacterium]
MWKMLFVFSLTATHLFASYKLDLTLKPDPPETGINRLEMKISDEANQPLDGADVSFIISMPAMGTMPYMEEIGSVTQKEPGLYIGSFDLAMGGSWSLAIRIKKNDSEEKFGFNLTTGIPGLTRTSEINHKSAQGGTTQLLPIGPERLQKIGVRFVEIKSRQLQKTVRAVGLVEPDNTKKSELALRFPGYVEKQFRGRVGDYVKAGTPLLSVYSPELVSAQEEFLLARGRVESESLQHSTAERLKNLGLSENDIAHVKNTGKPLRNIVITAPQSGTVLEINVREGSTFRLGQVLYSIGDLSKNFVIARIFQRDLNDLMVGQAADIIIPEADEPSYPGKIDLIFPNIGEGEGTTNVRIESNTPNSFLKPGIYVDLRFFVDLGSHLSVSPNAILYSGLNKYVFVDQGEGILEPRAIKTGKSTDEWIEVRSGLNEGERVAASGTFLISSEAQLSAALPKWEKEKGAKAGQPPQVPEEQPMKGHQH